MTIDRRRVYHKRDRLRQLRAFCCAARLGSLSKAAEHLELSQPAVSLQVRELEHELEARLFERGDRGVRLTAAGEQFYALSGSLVDEMTSLLEDFGEHFEDDVTGRLDIAASVAGVAIVLPPYVKRLRDRYPGVRLRVRSCGLHDGMALLRTGEVEMMLAGHEPLEDRAFGYREMCSYDIVLIVSRVHPLAGRNSVTLQEAAQWPAIVPPAGTSNRRFGETVAKEFGIDIRAVVEVGGWEAIKRYVERDIGVCVVPSLCLHETDQVTAIPLATQFPSQNFGVYTRRGKALTAPARRFLELLIPESAPSSGRGTCTGAR